MSSGKTCNEVSQCLIVVVLVTRKRKKKMEICDEDLKKERKTSGSCFIFFFILDVGKIKRTSCCVQQFKSCSNGLVCVSTM
ncbi:Uncharacterized protein APZ42_016890 [Daphnia magna]|uniref:Uncharacterized protein n=1 Tax=Daphnia magna TaxID=35525 RepID=A0A165A7I2_9CRUS|nr:Uncharacterized protein APZ42_016890 [Daphnia magna]